MGTVRGCDFPQELFYNIEHNVWVRPEEDGTFTLGMTSYACSLSGNIVAFTPKKVGKEVKRDKSCATVESGKWVGPIRAPVSGEVVAINEAVLVKPSLINDSPYAGGWLLRLRPFDWQGESVHLVTGQRALELYEAKMAADGFGGC